MSSLGPYDDAHAEQSSEPNSNMNLTQLSTDSPVFLDPQTEEKQSESSSLSEPTSDSDLPPGCENEPHEIYRHWKRWSKQGRYHAQPSFPSQCTTAKLEAYEPKIAYELARSSRRKKWTIANPFDPHRMVTYLFPLRYDNERTSWTPEYSPEELVTFLNGFEGRARHKSVDLTKLFFRMGRGVALSNEIIEHLSEQEWADDSASIQARNDFYERGLVTVPDAPKAASIPAEFHMTADTWFTVTCKVFSAMADHSEYGRLWRKGKVPVSMASTAESGPDTISKDR